MCLHEAYKVDKWINCATNVHVCLWFCLLATAVFFFFVILHVVVYGVMYQHTEKTVIIVGMGEEAFLKN